MAKLKPLEKLRADVGSGDIIMLHLENSDHNPVGYLWGDKEEIEFIY